MNTIIKTKNVFNISLIYSIISSFLIYKNPNGITMPFFVILTLLYMAYYFKSTNTLVLQFMVICTSSCYYIKSTVNCNHNLRINKKIYLNNCL